MLIIFAGLPGTGKTTVARELARRMAAVYLRIDSIEQAVRSSRAGIDRIEDAGYCAAYALAEDNLRLGLTVVADSVNPISITRDAWLSVAGRTGVKAVEVELVCSDASEHQHRAEARETDIPGLKPPRWDEVLSRQYEAWSRPHLVVDTAGRTVEQTIAIIQDAFHLRSPDHAQPSGAPTS